MPIDLTTLGPPEEVSLLPPGWFNATIERSEVRTSKKNQANQYINLMYDVEGKKIFEMINVKNDNPRAQSMSLLRAKKILTALGRGDSVFKDIHSMAKAFEGKLRVEVDIIHDSYKGMEINQIKDVSGLEVPKPIPPSFKGPVSKNKWDDNPDMPF